MGVWKDCTLADLGNIVGGATPSTKNPSNYENGNISWITPKDLSGFQGRYISHGERNITEQGLNSCSTQLLPKNSILFSSRAPIGYVAIADKELCTNQGFKSIVPNENTDYLFLYYLLKYNKTNIENMGSGTTFKEVSGNTMRSIPVRVPIDKEEQSKIAKILGCIDDKIEENAKINYNLEQQAITLFRKYYNTATAVVPFTSMLQVLGGGTPKTSEPSFWNGTIPFFTPKDVGFPYAFVTEKTITPEGLNHCNSRLYPLNTVFVTARGTVGKVSLAGCPMAMNQSCYALVGKDIDQLLAYHYTLVTVDKLKHKASGAVFDAIITKDFETESVSKISDGDADTFLAIAKPLYETILSNCLENQRLTSMKDALLPQLMSGKIDVSEVEI
ncbi:MAG: restriction endonuclease subunit S [Bacilli bacterium]|nr:restriction endonuclease subunit S [Bacilli bacterium]